MKILSKLFGSKNPIESMNIEELKVMEIKLNEKINSIQRDAKKIEDEIEALFEKAKETKSRSEELSIARRIKTLSQKKEAKLSTQAKLEKELRAVSNIIILKEAEDDLKSAGLWDRIRDLSPEELEKWLISKKLEAEDRDSLINTVIEMTSSTITTGVEYEEDLGDILEAIKAVKEGELEPNEAEKIIAKEEDKES